MNKVCSFKLGHLLNKRDMVMVFQGCFQALPLSEGVEEGVHMMVLVCMCIRH